MKRTPRMRPNDRDDSSMSQSDDDFAAPLTPMVSFNDDFTADTWSPMFSPSDNAGDFAAAWTPTSPMFLPSDDDLEFAAELRCYLEFAATWGPTPRSPMFSQCDDDITATWTPTSPMSPTNDDITATWTPTSPMSPSNDDFAAPWTPTSPTNGTWSAPLQADDLITELQMENNLLKASLKRKVQEVNVLEAKLKKCRGCASLSHFACMSALYNDRHLT